MTMNDSINNIQNADKNIIFVSQDVNSSVPDKERLRELSEIAHLFPGVCFKLTPRIFYEVEIRGKESN